MARGVLRGGLASPSLWLATAALLALACRGPAEWRYEAELADAPASAAHAVHDARLQELMRSLASLRRERLPQTLDPEAATERQAREVARVARAMAASAQRIPAAAPPDLAPEEQAELRALAARLAQQCETLAEEAPRLDAPEQRARLGEIDATCRGCHARFAIPWDAAEPG